MYKIFLLILALCSLASCSENNTQASEVKKKPSAVEKASVLFEPTGTTRGDIKNFITFTNGKLNKNKSELLSGLDDYLALVTDVMGECSDDTKYLYQVFEGSFGSFPSIRIYLENKIIRQIYLTLPVGVSASMVEPLLAKYSNYETFVSGGDVRLPRIAKHCSNKT
jgi:hypothetical protein